MRIFWKVLLITLAVIVVLTTSAWADSGKTIDRDRLVAIAQDKGSVKVIVRFDVPNIKKLTAASTAYKAATPRRIFPQEAVQADAALAANIASISGSVLSQLQLSGVTHKTNHTYSTVPLLALDVSEEALDVLEASPDVLSITEDKLLSPTLNNTISIIGANSAWDSGYTGSGWYVAVLDTGILSSHEFFNEKAIREACYSAESHCPNGQTEMTGTGAAAHHPNTYDGWDHGTHVSGIATGDNGTLFGVAKDADIIAVQVFSRFDNPALCDPYNSCVLAYTSDIIAGLQYVYSVRATYDIASVNMSLGGSTKYSDESSCETANADTKTAIDNLRSAGIATIISSGNDGWCDGISAPACISSAIAVGATTDGDAEADFNNWHPDLMDLWAPGVQVNSSVGDSDSSYESWSGTSMSAPHVAGSWAILKQKDPSASVASLLSAVSSAGVSVTTACPNYPGCSKPRIQVDSALSLIEPLIPTPPSSLSSTTISKNQINLSWTDNAANEDGFKIERKTGVCGTYSQITTVGQNVTTYSDTGLTEATTYYYRVRAYTSSEDSGYSSGASATTQSSSSGGGGGGGGGGGCFIATAAYGSPMHPYVETLRQFRDRYLLTNSHGRAFVGFYYKHSPSIADVIRDSESLKTVTRVILIPVVMFVIYPYTSLTIFIALLTSLMITRRRINSFET